MITRAGGRAVVIVTPLGVGPGLHGDKVGHKGGHGTLEERLVAQHDRLQEHMRLVRLTSHCKEKKKKKGDDFIWGGGELSVE